MSRSHGFNLAAPLVLLLSLLSAATSVAQEAVGRPAVVLGLVRPAAGADGALQEVLTSSIAVKLTRWGLQAITAPDTSLPGGGLADSEKLFALARRVEADYVLEGVYSNSQEEIEIQLAWYDVKTRQAAASVSKRGKVGLSMDRLLSGALAEILATVEKDLARFTRFEAAGGVAATNPEVPDQPGGASPAVPPSPVPAGPQNRQPPQNPQARPEPGPGEPGDAEGPTLVAASVRRKRLELSASGSAFIATGQAAEYFKIGYGSALHVDLLIPAGPGRLGLGLYAGVNYFAADGVATSAQSLLVPLGVDLRYTPDNSAPVGLFVHLSAGPAMLLIRSDYWGELAKLVPYALAGLGVNIPFSPGMGTAVELSYSAYFEGSLLIMAFSPSLSVYFRL